ncbi:hypothetical protein Tco_0122329 [Tanacetum coccineum]
MGQMGFVNDILGLLNGFRKKSWAVKKWVSYKSIPCSPECKIVGQILLDHPLSYALTATADIPAVYLQQFWRTVSKVPGPEEKVKFILNTQQFVYTVDMFRYILHFPVETPKNPFVETVNIETIKTFMNRVGYKGVVDKVDVLVNQPQPVISTKRTHRSTPREHRTPTLTASPQGKKRKQSAGESSSPQKSLNIIIRQQKVVEQEKDDADSENRLEPKSHKDNPKTVNDDADNYVEKVDEEERGNMGSLETKTEETQTTIPTPPRSPRTILSSDKNITQELMDNVPLPTTTITSHSKRRIFSKYSHLPCALRKMCRRQGYTIQNMERKCVTTKQFWKTHKKANQVLHQGVSQLAEQATEELIENNLKPCIAATIIEDRDAFHSEVPDLVSQEFQAQAPQIIEALFKNYVQSNVILVHPTTTTTTETTSSADLQQQLYFKMKKVFKIKLMIRHSKDSTIYVYKQQQQQQESDAWIEETVIDEDEVITEDETLELITELQDVDKRFPTIYDYKRMKATLNDALSNQFKNAEKSRVIWERVHDFQLGIKSYQIKINLTTPTLTFLGIEAHEPYSIVDKPSTCLIYLNSKEEKRVMYLTEIVKFCDATLEKVLKEVKLKIFQSEPWRKLPLLVEVYRDILRAFKREINKRLRHREQMRR